ncbi:MAG: hypothetical protein RBU27_08065 [Bacteroidota bacterium]|jgi:hypothetical protein|nr:hypothetical protein [Bacteroidota bacterium]
MCRPSLIPLLIVGLIFLDTMLDAPLVAQPRRGDVTTLLQVSAEFSDRTIDYSDNYSRDIRQHRIRRYFASVTPAFWLSDHAAIEVELGYQYSSAEQLYDGWGAMTEHALMVIPHVIGAFGTLDSVFIPYIRGGIGYSDNYSTPLVTSFGDDLRGDYPALVISLGAGGMYLLGPRVFLRGEFNYRTHHAEGGSNTSLVIDWSAFHFFLGCGIRW